MIYYFTWISQHKHSTAHVPMGDSQVFAQFIRQFITPCQILAGFYQHWHAMGRSQLFGFFTIRKSDAFLSDFPNRCKVTQNEINFINCPQWGLNPGPPHHNPNVLSTELSMNLLGRRFLKCALLISCTTSHVGLCSFLESIEHDFFKALVIHTDNQIVISLSWQSMRLMIQMMWVQTTLWALLTKLILFCVTLDLSDNLTEMRMMKN